jgi:hypothetical protein
MAKTVTTTITSTVVGDGFGGIGPLYNSSVVNATGLPPSSVTLAAGFNSIPVPATALGVLIVPPAGSTNGKTLKGITGDTGVAVAPAGTLALVWTAGQVATFGITSVAIETLTLIWQ